MWNEIITDLFSGRPAEGMRKLQTAAAGEPDAGLLSALRLAAQQPGQGQLYYQKAFNLWHNWGRPPLKPNPLHRKVLLLTDFTADGLVPLLSVFCGSWGVDADVVLPAFDSVEQLALGGGSAGSAGGAAIDADTIVVILLSEQWLTRYLGGGAIVSRQGVEAAREMYETVVRGVLAQDPNHVLLANFPGRAYSRPGSVATHGDMLGWNLACSEVNVGLTRLVGSNVHLVDLADAIFRAGGRGALGQASYFRAKLAYEPAGAIEITRELAGAIAAVCGKSHRALITDWDNTIWGGEVAEVGSFGVECGLDTPDGLAYTHVQEFLKGLKPMGILLGGVSRNEPTVTRIFEENPDVPLNLDDFAAIQVSYGPKSHAIGTISDEIGFGPEFMVFLDDSLFELVEALQIHPHLDILRAGPDPFTTLDALSASRFFNLIALSDADLGRSRAALSLRKQREVRRVQFKSPEEFLRKIEIRVRVDTFNEQNTERVVQMFQKSNQFNLTTRRHGEADLRRMLEAGGRMGVFAYEDAFGPQGVISVVMLMPDDDHLLIESWLMSCRVLSRTVEAAVFGWMVEQAGDRPLLGEYIPTERNGLVRDLFERMGMEFVSRDEATGAERWRYCHDGRKPLPRHSVELVVSEEEGVQV